MMLRAVTSCACALERAAGTGLALSRYRKTAYMQERDDSPDLLLISKFDLHVLLCRLTLPETLGCVCTAQAAERTA